jgi:hypothetical protein
MAKEDEGARQSRTLRKFGGMNAENVRYGVGDDEMFWLENVMPTAEGRLRTLGGPSDSLAYIPRSFLLLQTGSYLLYQDSGKIMLTGG